MQLAEMTKSTVSAVQKINKESNGTATKKQVESEANAPGTGEPIANSIPNSKTAIEFIGDGDSSEEFSAAKKFRISSENFSSNFVGICSTTRSPGNFVSNPATRSSSPLNLGARPASAPLDEI